MLFNGRRQSKDGVLRGHAKALAQGQPLWMNNYTAGQFGETDHLIVDEAFLEKAPEDAWCFVENREILPFLEKIDRIAVYRWNRLYPSDVKFPMDVFASRWNLISKEEFAGSSHACITLEVYQL